MPTINQLVRKPRKSKVSKSDSPALNKGYNSKRGLFRIRIFRWTNLWWSCQSLKNDRRVRWNFIIIQNVLPAKRRKNG